MDYSSSPSSPGSAQDRSSQAPHAYMVGWRSPGHSSPLRRTVRLIRLGPRTQMNAAPGLYFEMYSDPLHLLVQGEDQTIEIPMSVILDKVLKSLPARKGPV